MACPRPRWISVIPPIRLSDASETAGIQSISLLGLHRPGAVHTVEPPWPLERMKARCMAAAVDALSAGLRGSAVELGHQFPRAAPPGGKLIGTAIALTALLIHFSCPPGA